MMWSYVYFDNITRGNIIQQCHFLLIMLQIAWCGRSPPLGLLVVSPWWGSPWCFCVELVEVGIVHVLVELLSLIPTELSEVGIVHVLVELLSLIPTELSEVGIVHVLVELLSLIPTCHLHTVVLHKSSLWIHLIHLLITVPVHRITWTIHTATHHLVILEVIIVEVVTSIVAKAALKICEHQKEGNECIFHCRLQ